MTTRSLFDLAFDQACPSPTTCNAIKVGGKSLCSRKYHDDDGCYSHRNHKINVAQGRIVAEIFARSDLVGLGRQVTIPMVIQFVQAQWKESGGDRIWLAQAWFNSLETRPVPSQQKSPSISLDINRMAASMTARRSSTSVALGGSSPLASPALEEKGPVMAASIDPVNVGETQYYDTHSKSSGWGSLVTTLVDSVSGAKSTARADTPPEDHFPVRQSAYDPIPTIAVVTDALDRVRTSVSTFQPRVYHSSEDMDGSEAFDHRLDEILEKISALSIRLDQLQLIAFGSLEVQCILIEKLQHLVVSAHAD